MNTAISACSKKLVILFTIIPLIFCISKDNKIKILSPKNDSEVSMKVIVRGTTSDFKKKIYVLIHPMSTELWWVQPLPKGLNSDSTWQTIGYCGTEKDGIDEFYEIIAILSNKLLKSGQTLNNIPENSIKSDIITVYRKK